MPRRPLDLNAAPEPATPAAPELPASPPAQRPRGSGVRLRGESDGTPWTAYFHRDGGFELAWYDAAKKRKKARIPPSHASDNQIRAYAATTIRVVAEEHAKAAASAPVQPARPTFADVAKRWTSGELARTYPDHVKAKSSVDDDVQRLRDHVLDHVGGVALADFSMNDAERVLSNLPPHLSGETRRKVCLLVHRVIELAVFPCRVIPSNPLPRNWLPKPTKPKARTYLMPPEDLALLQHRETPLHLRMLFAYCSREGMRASEACALRWSDLDLDVGTITLDKNKTESERVWALDPGVVEALKVWREIAPPPAAREGTLSDAEKADWFVFVDAKGRQMRPEKMKLADDFRDALRAAGVKRPQLFERTAERTPIWFHDTRATFVTISLADGKNDTHVRDRTGHTTTSMMDRYRRHARTAAELGLGGLHPMHLAIPEIAERLPKGTGGASSGGGGRGSARSSRVSAVVSRDGLGTVSARHSSGNRVVSARSAGGAGGRRRSAAQPAREFAEILARRPRHDAR